MQNFNLTEKEAKLAQCGDINWSYFTDPKQGYYNVDGDPGLLCFTLNEARKAGFTRHEVAGILGSLEKKEVIYIEERGEPFGPTLYWLSEDFVNFIATQNKGESTK